MEDFNDMENDLPIATEKQPKIKTKKEGAAVEHAEVIPPTLGQQLAEEGNTKKIAMQEAVKELAIDKHLSDNKYKYYNKLKHLVDAEDFKSITEIMTAWNIDATDPIIMYFILTNRFEQMTIDFPQFIENDFYKIMSAETEKFVGEIKGMIKSDYQDVVTQGNNDLVKYLEGLKDNVKDFGLTIDGGLKNLVESLNKLLPELQTKIDVIIKEEHDEIKTETLVHFKDLDKKVDKIVSKLTTIENNSDSIIKLRLKIADYSVVLILASLAIGVFIGTKI